MIQLTYRNLLQTQLIPTLGKLNDMSVFDAKTAYRIHKIFDAIIKPYRECWNSFRKLGDKYAEKDSWNDPKTYPEGEVPRGGQHVVSPEKQSEYDDALAKLLDTAFTIEQHKLDVDALTVRLSGQEIAALAPIVDGLE